MRTLRPADPGSSCKRPSVIGRAVIETEVRSPFGVQAVNACRAVAGVIPKRRGNGPGRAGKDSIGGTQNSQSVRQFMRHDSGKVVSTLRYAVCRVGVELIAQADNDNPVTLLLP